MAVPVSIRTKNDFIADLCKPPLLGGFVIILIAFGPPTLIALLVTLVATLAGHGQLFFTSISEPGPMYLVVMFSLGIVWNLALMLLWHMSIRILYMPAWAISIMGIVVGLAMYFGKV